jgi:AraC-like DNA-binding protein
LPSEAPLAAYKLVSTRDPDEAQSIVSRELTDSRIRRVRSSQQFQFEMNGVHFGGAFIGWNSYLTDIDVENGLVEDTVAFVLGNRCPVFRMNDAADACTPSTAVVVSPSSMSIARPAGSSVFVLKASYQALERRFREITGHSPNATIRFDRTVDISNGPGAAARNTLLHVVSELENANTLLTNASLRVAINDLLLGTLLSLPHSHTDQLLIDPDDAEPSVVRRAEEYLEAHLAEPIGIRDVVEACGCSTSALYRAFQRYRGFTPNEFLILRRLEAARRKLFSPSQDDTVASIALACGLPHLGRFAASYKRRFGESPSETLQGSR